MSTGNSAKKWDISIEDSNVIKGLAISAMLWSHLFRWGPAEYSPSTSKPVILIADICAHMIVALFLFCSGYGLSAQFCKQKQNFSTTIRFIFKRLVKFYASFWAIFIIFLPIVTLGGHISLDSVYGEGNAISGLIKELFCIPGPSINTNWWFNKLIVPLYVLFPIIYYLIDRCWPVVLAGSLLIMRFLGNKHLGFEIMGMFSWQVPFVLGVLWHNGETAMGGIKDYFDKHRLLSSAIVIVFFAAVCAIGYFEKLF